MVFQRKHIYKEIVTEIQIEERKLLCEMKFRLQVCRWELSDRNWENEQ